MLLLLTLSEMNCCVVEILPEYIVDSLWPTALQLSFTSPFQKVIGTVSMADGFPDLFKHLLGPQFSCPRNCWAVILTDLRILRKSPAKDYVSLQEGLPVIVLLPNDRSRC